MTTSKGFARVLEHLISGNTNSMGLEPHFNEDGSLILEAHRRHSVSEILKSYILGTDGSEMFMVFPEAGGCGIYVSSLEGWRTELMSGKAWCPFSPDQKVTKIEIAPKDRNAEIKFYI